MVWMIFIVIFYLCSHAQQLLWGYYSTNTEFLARNGQIWPAQLPPTAFSNQCQSVSKKIKTKRKRMMGWIKNGPKKKLSWFFVCQHLPTKTNSFPFRFISLKVTLLLVLLCSCHNPLAPFSHVKRIFCRVASRFGISVRYRSVFSRYFTNRYQRKTRSGRFGIVHLAGTPFFPQREASAPFLMDQAPFLREK